MTDQDFSALYNDARTRGGVAIMLHPLVLVITTPEYVSTAPALNPAATIEQPLPISPAGGPATGQES